MKRHTLFVLIISAVFLLSACQKANAPANGGLDEPLPPVGEVMDEDRMEDADSGSEAGAMEEPGASSVDSETAVTTSMPVPAPGTDPATVDEMVVSESADAEPAMPDEVKSFSITAKRWEFMPSTITVNEGDRVRLSISSSDVDHGFAIPQFNVSQQLRPGETAIVEFVADRAGTYTFFCNVFCGHGHPDMKGTLIVQ